MADDMNDGRVGGSDMGNTASTTDTGGSEMGGAGGTATGGSKSGSRMEDDDDGMTDAGMSDSGVGDADMEGMTGDDTGIIAGEDDESGAGYGNHGTGQGAVNEGMNSDQR